MLRQFHRHLASFQLHPAQYPMYLLEKARPLRKMMATDPGVRQVNQRAARRYVPKVYPGRVTLFLASEEPVIHYPDPRLGWSDVARGGKETYKIPTSQNAMLREPYVGTLADQLRISLDEAQNDEPGQQAKVLSGISAQRCR